MVAVPFGSPQIRSIAHDLYLQLLVIHICDIICLPLFVNAFFLWWTWLAYICNPPTFARFNEKKKIYQKEENTDDNDTN